MYEKKKEIKEKKISQNIFIINSGYFNTFVTEFF